MRALRFLGGVVTAAVGTGAIFGAQAYILYPDGCGLCYAKFASWCVLVGCW